MSERFLWESGDEALRPTQKTWRCQKCGTKLYTVSAIEGHKARCKGNSVTRAVRGRWTSPVTGKTYEIR